MNLKLTTKSWWLVGAFVMLGFGCSKGAGQLELPTDRAKVPAFPPKSAASNLSVKANTDGPELLAIDRAEPSERSRWRGVVTVVFNDDMVVPTFGKPLTEGPLVFNPPMDGAYYWWGSRTLTFRPSKKLAPGTTYRVTVKKDIKSLRGKALDKDFVFDFQTPGLRRPSLSATSYRKLKPDDKFWVRYNLPVKLEDVKANVVLLENGVRKPFKLERGTEGYGKKRRPSKRSYKVVPLSPLKFDTTYKIIAQGNIKPIGGSEPLGRSVERVYRTYGDFAVTKIECGYRNKCYPYDRIRINFSNPVNVKDIEKCVSISPKVELKRSYGYNNSVSFRAPKWKSGQRYTLKVQGSCKDKFGNTLASNGSQSFTVGDLYPSISMQHGIVTLEPGKDNIFPVNTVNVPDINVKMMQVTESNFSKMMKYTSSYYGKDPFAAGFSPTFVKQAKGGAKNKAIDHQFDLNKAIKKGKKGLVYVQVHNPNKKRRRWQRNRVSHWAMVAITDMGLSVKRSPSETLVWVTSLSKTKPQPNTKVTFWNQSGKVMWEGTTDKDGIARGPVTKTDGNYKKRLRYVTATQGDELAFLDVQNYSSEMSPWRFRLPYSWNPKRDNIEGVIFTERGVYRSGETVHVKGLMRALTATGLGPLAAKRVKATVKTPRGDVLINKTFDLSAMGGFSFDIKLKEEARLGSYSIVVRPEGKRYADRRYNKYGYFRVEAYRAPRFEVGVKGNASDFIIGDDASVTINGRYLYGAPMQGSRARVYASMNRASFSPKGFYGYSFGDLSSWWYDWEGWGSRGGDYTSLMPTSKETSATLSSVGEAKYVYALKPNKSSKYIGPRRLMIDASVTDKDAQVISSSKSFMVHPGEYYVGVKRSSYMVDTNKPFDVNMVAVSHKGQMMPGKSLVAKLVERKWVSVKKKSTGGGTTWVSERKDTEVAKCNKTSLRTPVKCSFTVKNNGTYVVVVESQDSKGRRVEAKQAFYAWSSGGGDSWWKRRDDAVITVISDKQTYKVGDTAKLLVRSPFKKARALVTVERENVLSHKIIDFDQKKDATLKIPVTKEMMPNAFVGVTLLRGRLALKDIDKKLRKSSVDPGKPAFKMGYAQIKVDTSDKVLNVGVEANKKTYRPGEEVSVDLSLKDINGNPIAGEVTFYAVDEGVLSLTGYRVPKPQDRFYRLRPIAVRNYESRLKLLAKIKKKGRKGSPGGDGEADAAASMNYRNKFATTATYQPLVKVDASGKARVTFKLPDNLTTYRLMAVAVGESDRFGSSSSRITVNKPLLVRPALPRFASTGDQFKLRAVVQSLDRFSGPVTVTASVKGSLALQGETSQTLEMQAGKATVVSFDVTANDPGEAIVRFNVKAQSGDADDAVEVKLPVKFPAATRQIVASGMLTPDSPNLWRRLVMDQNMHQSAGSLEVELSSTSFGELLPGLDYLVDYPYGCAEQTTGRTLPMVVLQDQLKQYELASVPSEKLPEYVQSGVDRLLSMQTYTGGLGYWPGAYKPHPWASVYGGLAIVLAKERGYKVNKKKYERLMAYLKRVLRGRTQARYEYWKPQAVQATSVYAAYVLARAGMGDASYNERLFNQRQNLPNWAKGLLLMAINQQKKGGALTNRKANMINTLYKDMLKGVTVANNEATLGKPEEGPYWVVMPSETKSNAIALMATLAVKPQDDLVGQLARQLLMSRRNGHWYSTQANAFAIMALSEYFDTLERKAPNYDVKVGLDKKVLATKSFKGRKLGFQRVRIPMADLTNKNGKLLTVMREGEGGPLYYSLKLKYAPRKAPINAIQNGFAIQREYFYADGPNKDKKVGSNVKVGDVIRVRLTIVASDDRKYVALDEPLPAGFEIVNTRFRTTSRRLSNTLSTANDEGDWWSYWWYAPRFDFVEQKDDRVLLFSNSMGSNVYTHNYLVRATTPGTFTAASARIEEMYHPNVFGQTEARTFVIQ